MCERKIRAFALFGVPYELPLAAAVPDHQAVFTASRHLLDIGDRKIVFLTFCGRRWTNPGPLWRTLFEELESRAIRTGPYTISVNHMESLSKFPIPNFLFCISRPSGFLPIS